MSEAVAIQNINLCDRFRFLQLQLKAFRSWELVTPIPGHG